MKLRNLCLSTIIALGLSTVAHAQAAVFSINATWTNPTTGGMVSSIEVQESKDNGATWTTIVSVGPNMTTAAKAAIPGGFLYLYRVVARGPFGASAPMPVTPFPVAAFPPDSRGAVVFTVTTQQ